MTAARAKTGLSDRQIYEVVHLRMRALAGPAAGDLDDLIQLAAEQTFRSLERFDGSCELSTWVYAVCYRVLLNQRRWFRRFRLRFTPLGADDDSLDEAPTPPELLEARARARSLAAPGARAAER